MLDDWIAKQVTARGISDERILQVMRQVPRELFVPADQAESAHEDYPLPIGYGQTISQPYIVALMTELLELEADDRVLEIGTGSGYQTAILAELATEVYSVEVVPELQKTAEERLQRLGYDNVHLKIGDGYIGWREHAPYDAIIVTAAPPEVPEALKEQLAEGGRLVIPVGPAGDIQTLWRIIRRGKRFLSRPITEVAFVPLLRQASRGRKGGRGSVADGDARSDAR